MLLFNLAIGVTTAFTPHLDSHLDKSLIQRIEILPRHKDTAQSEYRKSRIVLCEVMVSALVNEEVIF